MNNNYFRITAYNEEEDFSCILDSNGMFEKLWQFSAFLVKKGFRILEVSNSNDFIDVNIAKSEENKETLFLKAIANKRPEHLHISINGISYHAIRVGAKIYIPNKNNIIK